MTSVMPGGGLFSSHQFAPYDFKRVKIKPFFEFDDFSIRMTFSRSRCAVLTSPNLSLAPPFPPPSKKKKKKKKKHDTSAANGYSYWIKQRYSPEKWLHNWIATGPNKSKKLTRLTSPAHTTHGKVRINPLEIWVVMQRASKQRSSRCDHANSGPVVRFSGWTQLCV